MDLSTTDFDLTEKEQKFVGLWLANVDNGAETIEDLLADNYSCMCLEDFDERPDFFNYSAHQVSGFLSSLQDKCIIFKDIRDGDRCPKGAGIAKQFSFEPNLYWINDSYLCSLPNIKIS